VAGMLVVASPPGINAVIASLDAGGFVVAGVAGCREPGRPTAILSVLWLFLAFFDTEYALHWKLPEWVALDGWWTYLIASVAFFSVGCVLRREPRIE